MLENQQKFSPTPWYKEGLRFSCTGCGGCCTGAPGEVPVSQLEIQEISTFLNMTVDLFMRRYLRLKENRYLLTEKKKTYDCIFLKDKKCGIYKVRPKQCRTYPWWKENLNSEDSWNEEAKRCEGITQNAPVVSFEEISTNLYNP